MAKKKISINIPELEKEFLLIRSENMTYPVASGTLEDGRQYQVHVTITTDEDEFLEEEGDLFEDDGTEEFPNGSLDY